MENETFNFSDFAKKETKENKRKKRLANKVKPKNNYWKLKLMVVLTAIALFVAGVAYCAEKYADWRAEHEWQMPIEWVGFFREIEPNKQVLQTIKPVVEVQASDREGAVVKESWTGKVSYYESGAGCMGCHPNEIMANGQKFDENAMTLAFNRLPLNSKVRVTNLDNGANIIATVTDTGGFESYGRIADLSKGLMQELHAFTDTSSIRIEAL